MLIPVLSFIHNMTTMLFGIFMSAFFLGVKQNKKNTVTLLILSAVEGALYLTFFLLFGETTTNHFYSIIIHLPLILLLVGYYKFRILPSCIAVSSAYLCCQISNWTGILLLTITDALWCYYIVRIITTLVFWFFLSRFVCRTTQTVFAKETKELCIIGFLPFVYYVFDYTFTKLTDLFYSGNRAIIEFMGFAFCISYLAFLFVYFREYESERELDQYNQLMQMQLISIQNEIEQVKKSKHTLSILRHDMRHHLDLILAQLQNDNQKQAIHYIRHIRDAYDDTVIVTYCKNETLNSVISIYQMRFSDRNIDLDCNISVRKKLPCPDIAICTILSNALENSMYALAKMDLQKKWTKLTISEKGTHLLIQIENPILQSPKFVDGIPTSDKKGHGIGTKSIVYYTEQLNGQCHFSVSDHTFLLRIII